MNTPVQRTVNLVPELAKTIDTLLADKLVITQERKLLLKQLSGYINSRTKQNKPVLLNFICTHNSRRSHISQVWAQAASYYYGIDGVYCFSGGTEATAFNPRAVNAMQQAGFEIRQMVTSANPVYEVRYATDAPPIKTFSKKFDDQFNPSVDFAAIMTCSHADENCPFVAGAVTRIALTYDDPKDFDGTPQESEKYTERVMEIGKEILFAFSRVTQKQ
jgi:arsenate reductase (thioredoxin)